MRLVGGVFVGGSSTRMGGRPKGLLMGSDGRSLVQRAAAVLESIGAAVVLVGRRPEYEGLGIPAIEDQPKGIGPLGGLVGLLASTDDLALALACDMPLVDASLLGRLVDAPPAPIVAPRRAGRWEPLCARYDARAVRPIARRQADAGSHSLQALLDRCGAIELELQPDELAKLADWDSPEDVRRA